MENEELVEYVAMTWGDIVVNEAFLAALGALLIAFLADGNLRLLGWAMCLVYLAVALAVYRPKSYRIRGDQLTYIHGRRVYVASLNDLSVVDASWVPFVGFEMRIVAPAFEIQFRVDEDSVTFRRVLWDNMDRAVRSRIVTRLGKSALLERSDGRGDHKSRFL